MPPVGPLRSAGVTPPLRYYRPIRQALAFAGLRLLGSPDYLASVVFLHGARSPSLFQTHGLVRVPPLSTPPGGCSAGRFRNLLLPSPLLGRLGTRNSQFTEPQPSVHSSLRPAHSLTLPNRASSIGFTGDAERHDRERGRPARLVSVDVSSSQGISPPSAIQAMRLRPLAASGLSPYGPMGTSRHHPTMMRHLPHPELL